MQKPIQGRIIVGRYQLVQLIGVGGLAHVYLGWDHVLQRNVAVKLVRPDLDTQDSHYQMAWKEATVTATLQHPNIVTIFDYGIDEHGPYLVMELLKGHSLEQLVQRGPLPMDVFEQVAVQALDAMALAHTAGIIHCDLKPSNIMIQRMEASGRLNIKVLDFGISKFMAELASHNHNSEHAVLGSIYYMAPEMIDHHVMDQRSDLYSLGHVLFHALAGHTAIVGENVDDMVEAHRSGQFQRLDALRPDLPPSLCEWIHYLSQTHPEDRPFSAASALALFLDVIEENLKASAASETALPAREGGRRLWRGRLIG
jgi:serine/threonine protein kinase